MKTIKVVGFGMEEIRYYPINDENLMCFYVDEDGDYFESKDGYAKGFYNNGKIICDENREIFDEVEFKIVSSEVDFYGVGYDKVIALVDGEEKELVSSRWNGSSEYYFEN